MAESVPASIVACLEQLGEELTAWVQGYSVLDGDTEERQGGDGVGGVVAPRRREIRGARLAEQPDDRVPQRRHDLGNTAAPYLGSILPERHVTYPMRAVLDPPMVVGQPQEARA